jgi:hypothetical protein
MFAQYSTVRVKALLHPVDKYDGGWNGNRRAPAIGDTGAVIEIIHSAQQDVAYVVECVNADGSTEWLAQFSPEELESSET